MRQHNSNYPAYRNLTSYGAVSLCLFCKNFRLLGFLFDLKENISYEGVRLNSIETCVCICVCLVCVYDVAYRAHGFRGNARWTASLLLVKLSCESLTTIHPIGGASVLMLARSLRDLITWALLFYCAGGIGSLRIGQCLRLTYSGIFGTGEDQITSCFLYTDKRRTWDDLWPALLISIRNT